MKTQNLNQNWRGMGSVSLFVPEARYMSRVHTTKLGYRINIVFKKQKNSNNNNNRTCRTVNFAVPVDHSLKIKENEKKNKYLDFARELEKIRENESDGNTNYNWWARNIRQRIN